MTKSAMVTKNGAARLTVVQNSGRAVEIFESLKAGRIANEVVGALRADLENGKLVDAEVVAIVRDVDKRIYSTEFPLSFGQTEAWQKATEDMGDWGLEKELRTYRVPPAVLTRTKDTTTTSATSFILEAINKLAAMIVGRPISRPARNDKTQPDKVPEGEKLG